MSRRKTPEFDTPTAADDYRAIETIANKTSRNDKVSWERKLDNMVRLVTTVRPIEDAITDLIVKKQPILDDIQALRDDMVKECIHPLTHLAVNTDPALGKYVECKFCFKRFSFPR